MAYSINFTNTGLTSFSIDEGGIDGPGYPDRNTDITLVGKNRTNYGTEQEESLVHMLENFSHPQSAPGLPDATILAKPLKGQLWFNSTTGVMYVNTGTVASPVWSTLTTGYLKADGSVAMTGFLDMGVNRIRNLVAPALDTDAATKKYVDDNIVAGGISQGAADVRYVNVTGDTMTGTLELTTADIIINGTRRYTLRNGADNKSSHIYNATSGFTRIVSGITSTSRVEFGFESTYGVASTFTNVASISNDGSFNIGSIACSGSISSGQINVTSNKIINVATCTANGDAANKAYVDSKVVAGITQGDADIRYVNVTGDTMTGTLIMGSNFVTCSLPPASGTQLANKAYVDTKQTALGFTPVQQGGGIGQATNKLYIGWSTPAPAGGSRLKLTVDTINIGNFVVADPTTGRVANVQTPVASTDAANKAYVDTKQAALGFTPVQQGGGINQTPNKLYIGWSGTLELKATVDATDVGNFMLRGANVPAQHKLHQQFSPPVVVSANINASGAWQTFNVVSLGVPVHASAVHIFLSTSDHGDNSNAHIYTNTSATNTGQQEVWRVEGGNSDSGAGGGCQVTVPVVNGNIFLRRISSGVSVLPVLLNGYLNG